MFFVVESLRVDVFRRWLRSSSSRSVCLLKRYWSNFKAPLPKPLAVQFLFLLLFCNWATSSWIIKVRFDCVEKFASAFWLLEEGRRIWTNICYQMKCIQSGAEGFIGLLHYKACCLTKAKVFYVAKVGRLFQSSRGEKRLNWTPILRQCFRANAHEHAQTDVRMQTISIQLIGPIRNGFVTPRLQRECPAYWSKFPHAYIHVWWDQVTYSK